MGFTDFPNGVTSFGGIVLGAVGIGNVYYVCKTTDTAVYADMWKRYGGSRKKYEDDSLILHSTIQSALDATVECRNDYVIVMPSDSDYDLTAVLTMSKKSVHLICPAGLGYDVGATNAARIHQTTDAAVIAVSDSSIEIAGFYLKPYVDASSITIAATSYGLNIHHNFFTLNWDSAPSPVIACTGDGGAWGLVSHRNLFGSLAGDDVTCASMVTIGAAATGARCNHNSFVLGDGNIATVGITNSAVKGETHYNTFSTGGGVDGGTFTHCLDIHGSGTAIGNRATVADSELVAGGTDELSFSDNMNSVAGGVIDDQDG